MKLSRLNLLITMQMLVSIAVLSFATPIFACTISPITQPILGHSAVELQPELHWEAPSDVQFRVQISVLAPEARVLMSVDTVVNGRRFKLPSAIPSNFAAVKVLVSQNCPQLDEQDLNAQGPAFFINNRESCVLDTGIERSGQDTMEWGKSRDATEYVARLFATKIELNDYVSSELLATYKTSETQWKLPDAANLKHSKNIALIASVQPMCNGHPGVVQSLFLRPLDLKN
jgi:hypothetical protein